MDENMNNENNNSETEEKTFTQEDVNRIIGERLAKEKAKGEQEFSKKEQQLQQRELRLNAKEMLSEKGLSTQLVDALNCTSNETLEKSVSILEDVFNKNKNEAQGKLRGVEPNFGVGGRAPHILNNSTLNSDSNLRKAMGIQR
ncbi:MAG: DUF4355 domain-containing protein [Vallitalea sp.]|nr:DUF4355 domain-containing protein [Vallitalea sp.]